VQVGNPLKYILLGLREAVTEYRRDAALSKLRLGNPSCVIRSQNLSEVNLGENVVILEGVSLKKVSLGSFSYVGCSSSLSNADVENFCSIGPNVKLGLAKHPSRTFVSTHPAFYSNQNAGCPLSFRKDKVFDDSVPATNIGSDVWIGANVIIPGGICIGTGAIVAAGSVVVKDVPPYAVVGGNPAQIIRYRFTGEQIEFLLASEWWKWPVETIRRNVEVFMNIEGFKTSVNEVLHI
jgi:acetyltransferase-like isoleucine patch superfamily enzyme